MLIRPGLGFEGTMVEYFREYDRQDARYECSLSFLCNNATILHINDRLNGTKWNFVEAKSESPRLR